MWAPEFTARTQEQDPDTLMLDAATLFLASGTMQFLWRWTRWWPTSIDLRLSEPRYYRFQISPWPLPLVLVVADHGCVFPL